MRNKFALFDKFRKWIHPLLLKAMPGRRSFPIEVCMPMQIMQGNKIYVMNHSSIHDIPIACEVIKEHFYVLLGRQSLEIMDKFFFRINGVVYVDRTDKKSKKVAMKKMLQILNRGNNLLIYPEGTWNITPNKPILPLYWGVIELAKISGVPIIPLVAEYHPECCYVSFGQPLYIGMNMDKKKGIEQLEDTMATLIWNIWERFSINKRQDQMKEEFENVIRNRIAQNPKNDQKNERYIVRGWENSPEYVFGEWK